MITICKYYRHSPAELKVRNHPGQESNLYLWQVSMGCSFPLPLEFAIGHRCTQNDKPIQRIELCLHPYEGRVPPETPDWRNENGGCPLRVPWLCSYLPLTILILTATDVSVSALPGFDGYNAVALCATTRGATYTMLLHESGSHLIASGLLLGGTATRRYSHLASNVTEATRHGLPS